MADKADKGADKADGADKGADKADGGMFLLGLDPGLQATGWGVVEIQGTRLRHIADGTIRTSRSDTGGNGGGESDTGARILSLTLELRAILARHRPQEAALESSFFHRDASAALKLGKVCGVCLLAAGEAGVPIWEYPPNLVKKSVVGYGHADKGQIRHMVARLLAGAAGDSEHAADALAVAICHAQHRSLRQAQAQAQRTQGERQARQLRPKAAK